jgi:hypothetical protein
MHRLARLGAQARLEEIHREESAIRKAFPELFNSSTRPVRTAAAAAGAGAAADTAAVRRRRRRSNMSPAMRKAVSERMKKYWAERRKSSKK